MILRRLGPDDAGAVRDIRLSSLRDAPDAYGSTPADRADAPLPGFAERALTSHALGAFGGDALVGPAVTDREKGGNARRRALVTAVLVRPEARGRGSAAAMENRLAEAAAEDGIVQLGLNVLTANVSAIRACGRAGFQRVCTHPRAILSRGVFFDERLMIRRLDA